MPSGSARDRAEARTWTGAWDRHRLRARRRSGDHRSGFPCGAGPDSRGVSPALPAPGPGGVPGGRPGGP
ncbi:hypothetical protein D1871_08795 [Nakamurella silvestris]|nr:hypothetical protein D1871_08795 [Nakamurella silvestris]